MRSQKRTKVFSLGRKWVFTLALFLLVFAAASAVKVQAASKIMGWLGGWSEDGNIGGSFGWPPDGTETGVGWISMDNTNPEIPAKQTTNPYSVTIDNAGKVSGYAWANASNSPNSTASQWDNGLGWIDFNPQYHCTTGTPDATKQQYKAASCTPSAGCSAGVSRSGDVLTGCARLVSIAQASVTGNNGGWDGWIKMSGKAKDNSDYGVNIDPGTGKFCAPGASTTKEYDSTINGKYHCFAWNGEEGLTVTATQKNMANGLGWIDFAGASVEPIYELEFTKDGNPVGGIWPYENDTNNTSLASIGVKGADGGTCKDINVSSSDNALLTINNANIGTIVNPNRTALNITTWNVTVDTSVTITATSSNCLSTSLTAFVQNVPVCTLTCPSEIVVTTGQTKSVKSEIGITGEAGCTASAINCSESGTDTNGNIDVTSGCDVSETGNLRYGSSELRASGGTGSCTSPITVKGPGWVETSP